MKRTITVTRDYTYDPDDIFTNYLNGNFMATCGEVSDACHKYCKDHAIPDSLCNEIYSYVANVTLVENMRRSRETSFIEEASVGELVAALSKFPPEAKLRYGSNWKTVSSVKSVSDVCVIM